MRKYRNLLWLQLLVLPLIVFSSFSGCDEESEIVEEVTPPAGGADTPVQGEDSVATPYISVLPEGERVYRSFAQADTLIVSSSGVWQVSDVPEWVSAQPESGTDGDTLFLRIEANGDSAPRNAVLNLQSGSASAGVSLMQYGHVATDYVDLRIGEPGVSVSYDSASGSLSVSYADGRVPSVSAYQAIVLPAEYGYDIRVIESHRTSGNTLQFETSQGNMNHLFRNTSFTLVTNPTAPTRSVGGRAVYTPVSYGVTDADGHYTELYSRNDLTRAEFSNGETLWEFHTDFNGQDIISGSAGRLYWETLSFDAALEGEFTFDFGEKQIDQVRRRGDIRYFSYRLTGSMEADMKLHYHYDYSHTEETDEIIDDEFLPTRTFKFMVGTVPVVLNVDTKLGKQTLFEVNGRVDATAGVCMGNQLTLGAEWTPASGVQLIKPESAPTFTPHLPTIEADATLEGKVSYYPRIEIELYKFFGPWAEPRPYLKSTVEAGMRASMDGGNHVGWKAGLYNGLDLRVGLGLDVFGVDADIYESDIMNPVEDKLLFQAPARLRLLSPQSGTEVEAGESLTAHFVAESYCPLTQKYYPCPLALVNFRPDAGTCSPTVATADANGEVSVEWTTTTDSKTLTAHIVDKEGTDIDKVTFDVEKEENEANPDDYHPHAVDLGLPSGLKWATCNVGASSPEEYGDYFAWGDMEKKSDYDYDTYIYHNYITDEYTNLGSNISSTQYDVAHVKWGSNWRMPTYDEIKELIKNCTWQWTTHNGVNGQLVTGPNGNSIFLPATGWYYGTNLNDRGTTGCYWSATQLEGYSGRGGAYQLYIYDGYRSMHAKFRYYGLSVRPVTDGLLSDNEK